MKERYLHAVRVLLDCPSEEKERLLSRLSNAVTAYLEDFPEASEAELTATFGAPVDCAAYLLEECAPTVIVATRQKKGYYHRILTAVLAILLVIAVSVAGYLLSTGGLVIIQQREGKPDYWDSLPSDHIIYNYDD